MPRLYLSPSTQEHNLFVTGGTEEEYMNQVADAAVPWLDASGFVFTRNTPHMTAASSIAQANAGRYDLYFAIHSNAAPEGRYGEERGSLPYYYPTSSQGRLAANLVADNARKIYPLPGLVRTVAAGNIGELRLTRMPAVLWEVAYHDNVEDAEWIKGNIENIGWAVAASVAEYFGLPLVDPQPPQTGVVITQSGNLNIRARPTVTSGVIGRAPGGSAITVLGRVDDLWWVVRRGHVTGYAASRYIRLD